MGYDNDNKLMGILGALLGACLGIIIWCILGKLGIIAWIGGFAICYGTIGGYFLLGKSYSKVGIIICLLIIVASVYLATRLNWTIGLYSNIQKDIASEGDSSYFSNWTFGFCFKNIGNLIKMQNKQASFYTDLGLGYFITLLAGISAARKIS